MVPEARHGGTANMGRCRGKRFQRRCISVKYRTVCYGGSTAVREPRPSKIVGEGLWMAFSRAAWIARYVMSLAALSHFQGVLGAVSATQICLPDSLVEYN